MRAVTSRRKSLLASALAGILATLLCTPVADAIPFRGSISGQITTTSDPLSQSGVILPLFGINSPLFVGDVVTGFYSYDSPTMDGNLSTFQHVHITLSFGNIANTLGYFADGGRLIYFNVVGGIPQFFSSDDASTPPYYTHISVDETRFNLIDIEGNDWRQITGSLTSGPVSQVPESGCTMLLTSIAFGVLAIFRAYWRPPGYGKRPS